MAAGEGDGGRAEPFGHGQARAARDHLAGFRADPDHDAGRRGAERVEVVPVGVAGDDVLPEERVVPGAVVLGRQPEGGGIRGGLVGVTGRQRSLVADERDELRHRRAEAAALVRLRMSTHAASTGSRSGSSCEAGGSCATSVRTCSGCLATRASALTAPPLLAKISTGPASSAEISRCRSSACSSGVVSAAPSVRSAAVRAAGVVGDYRSVGEMAGQGDEAGGAHRRPDDQQDRLGTGFVAPDVVGQHGARHVQGVGLRVGHGCPLRRVLGLCQC